MQTKTLTPREMSTMPLDALIERTRRHWPAGVTECDVCGGSGEETRGFDVGWIVHQDQRLERRGGSIALDDARFAIRRIEGLE